MDTPALADLAAKSTVALHAAATVPGDRRDATGAGKPSGAISVARVRTTPIVPVSAIVVSANASPTPSAPTATPPANGLPANRMTFAAPSMGDSVRAPSTLAAQAASLGGSAPAALQPSHGGAAMTAPSALGGPSAGSIQIQIGAYASAGEAEKALAAAKAKAGGLLDRASSHAMPAGGAKPMVRARFGGFDQASATSTCLELRRKSIDCFVTR